MASLTKGTVLSLNPSAPVTCRANMLINDAAKLMVETRENCLLIIDEEDESELLGIITAKDLAFRGIGKDDVVVKDIMTPNPLCATTKTKAGDALRLMILKKFRHLPVVDSDSGVIVGVLEITKCYNEAMKRLEKLYEESKKFYGAMEIVNKELGQNSKSLHIVGYFESLRKLLEGPKLEELLQDGRTMPVYCGQDMSVYDVAQLMRVKKTTAVLIKGNEDDDGVLGIITSKDVVSRVIGRGIDAKKCLVVDVMTKNAKSAGSKTSINSALKQMFEGKYLNLPVVSENSGDIVGVVDIIRLTHYALSQIQTMETLADDDDDEEPEEGSEFNKFLENMVDGKEEEEEEEDDDDNECVGDVSMDEMSQFDMSYKSNVSSRGPKRMTSLVSMAVLDYDEVCFFKFSIFGGGRSGIHRVSFKPSDGIKALKGVISEEIGDGFGFEVTYVDEDDDVIVVTSDRDLKDCVLFMKSAGREKIELVLYDSHELLLGKKGKMRKSGHAGSTVPGWLLPLSMFTLAATIAVVAIKRR